MASSYYPEIKPAPAYGTPVGAYASQPPPPPPPPQQRANAIPTGLPVDRTAPPVYLGATAGHARGLVTTCPHCGFSGVADTVRVSGAASCFAAILTFGLSACCCGDAFKDTYHHCPQCSKVLACAKMA